MIITTPHFSEPLSSGRVVLRSCSLPHSVPRLLPDTLSGSLVIHCIDFNCSSALQQCTAVVCVITPPDYPPCGEDDGSSHRLGRYTREIHSHSAESLVMHWIVLWCTVVYSNCPPGVKLIDFLPPQPVSHRITLITLRDTG